MITGSPEDLTASKIDQATHARERHSVFSRHRLVVLFFILMIFAAAVRPISDPDFWWHLKTGQYIAETKTIPHTDIFSTLRFGSEWVTHEWLSEVLMYFVFRAAGFGGITGTVQTEVGILDNGAAGRKHE